MMEIPPQDIIALIGVRIENGWLEQCVRWKRWRVDEQGQRTGFDEQETWMPVFQLKRKPGRPAINDWNSVDWSKSNLEIAKELGCSTTWVSTHRTDESRTFEYKHRKFLTTGKWSKIDWKEVDWRKTNAQLGHELGISNAAVNTARRVLGAPHPTWTPGRRKIQPEEIDKIDWNLRDIEIAKQFDVSRERIRQIRADLQKQRSPYKWKQSKIIQIEKWLQEHRSEIEGQPVLHVAKQIPLLATRQAKYKLMHESGIAFNWNKPCPRNTDVLNFDLPNILLEMIWGLSGNHAGTARYRWATGPVKWNIKAKCDPAVFDDPALHAAIAKEIDKAKSCGLKPDISLISSYFQWRKGGGG